MLEQRRPTAVDYFELGAAFGQELEPPAIPEAFARACLSGYPNHKLGGDRTVELLRGAITADDLPVPQELHLDALRSEFLGRS